MHLISVVILHIMVIIVRASLVSALTLQRGCRHNHVVLNSGVSVHKFIVSDFGPCLLKEELRLRGNLGEFLLTDNLIEDDISWARVLRNLDHFLVKCFLLPVINNELLLLLHRCH